VSTYPDWSFGYAKLGVVHLEQGSFRDAISFLDKANTLEKNAFAYRCLTIAHNQLGEHEEAVSAINMAYEMDESIIADREAMLAAVYSYAAIGKLEVAKNLLAMTLQAQPDLPKDPRYQDTLGYLKKRTTDLGNQEQ